jgi:hypothetical protein
MYAYQSLYPAVMLASILHPSERSKKVYCTMAYLSRKLPDIEGERREKNRIMVAGIEG